MSFSSRIKTELAEIDSIAQCCYHAQVYGLVLFAHFSLSNFSIKTENKEVFELYRDCVREHIGCNVTESKTGSRMYLARVEDPEDIKKAFSMFGHSEKDMTVRINHANFQNDCCISSFLRGAFLACGSVSDPESNYHLEFVVPYKKLSQDLMRVLSELELSPKYIQRKGNHIVYFKDSENIEDLLAYIGAQNACLYLMNVKIEKDVKNNINRKINFEVYNIGKASLAADNQIKAINYITEHSDLHILPDNLRAIAVLRLNNPEASLSQLQTLSEEKISKSGLKHRLDKIVEIASDLEEKNSKL